MRVGILQSNYIPWKGYFDLISECDVFCFYDEVQYTKNDWRNRNKILGKNGEFWLTIPVLKSSVKNKISEVKLTDHSWQIKHLRSIEQAYNRSPFKKDVLSLIEPIYLNKNWESLSKLNQFLIKEICYFIGISTVFKESKDFNLSGGKIDRLVNLIVQLKGTTYISGPAAKNYLIGSENLFLDKKIDLEYKKYGPYLKYCNHQTDTISILDVLMNVPREEALSYVKSLKK